MKTVAYLRVSKKEQDLEKDRGSILFLGNDKKLGNVEFVEEKRSGKIHWRKRKIGEIIEKLSRDDNLLITEISRLGRSMLEVMEILSIATDKGIKIYSVSGWTLDGSLQSKVVAMAFSIAAEVERDLISERTKRGLAARREKGLPLGRPKGPGKSKLDKYKPEIEALLENGSTQRFIARRYSVAESTLFRWIQRNGQAAQDLLNRTIKVE